MDDEEFSIIDLIDVFIDDARMLVVYINVALISTLFVSTNLLNSPFYNVMTWIMVVVTAIDVVLTVIDLFGIFFDGNTGSGIFSTIINVAMISIAVDIAVKFIDLTDVQLSTMGVISVGATLFCLLSLLFSTITQWSVLLENLRLVLIFAILIIGMYNLLGANLDGSIFGLFAEISEMLPVLIFGILALDMLLCLVDGFKSLTDGLNGWDVVTFVLNAIVFAAFVFGAMNAEELFDLFLKYFGLTTSSLTYTFSNKLLIGFIIYVAVDLALAVPVNFISNVADVIEMN